MKNISKRTERGDEAIARPDVTKNFTRLPKSHAVPQPNDAGEIVVRALYKKSGKTGVAKGGIKYS